MVVLAGQHVHTVMVTYPYAYMTYIASPLASLGGAYRGGRPPTACFTCCMGSDCLMSGYGRQRPAISKNRHRKSPPSQKVRVVRSGFRVGVSNWYFNPSVCLWSNARRSITPVGLTGCVSRKRPMVEWSDNGMKQQPSVIRLQIHRSEGHALH